MRLLRVLTPVLAALALPAPAAATWAEAGEVGCALPPCVAELNVEAHPGERNELSITREPDGAVVVTDGGAPVEARSNCTPLSQNSVRCAVSRPISQALIYSHDGDDVVRTQLGPLRTVLFGLGDGDDRVEGDLGEESDVWAGPGNDVLIASGAGGSLLRGDDGDDELRGGDGADELIGGAGRDRLAGGAGDDELWGADLDTSDFVEVEVPAADVLDGGEGRDRVTYAARRGPNATAVVVNLATLGAPAGSPGENDRLRSIEWATGGDRDDALYGDDGPNILDGQGGADVLDGRGGDDRLRGGHGHSFTGKPTRPERITGGHGDDMLASAAGVVAYLSGGDGDDRLSPGLRGVASCGAGADLVRAARGVVPPISEACERWSMRIASTAEGPLEATFPHPRRVGGVVRLNVPCPRSPGWPCRVVMRVRTPGGRTLGQARATLRANTRRTLGARMPRHARRGSFRARVTLAYRRPPTSTWIERSGVLATVR